MKLEKFVEFWNSWSGEWYMLSFDDGQNEKKIGSLCTIKKEAAEQVHGVYESIKEVVKDSYFNRSIITIIWKRSMISIISSRD